MSAYARSALLIRSTSKPSSEHSIRGRQLNSTKVTPSLQKRKERSILECLGKDDDSVKKNIENYDKDYKKGCYNREDQGCFKVYEEEFQPGSASETQPNLSLNSQSQYSTKLLSSNSMTYSDTDPTPSRKQFIHHSGPFSQNSIMSLEENSVPLLSESNTRGLTFSNKKKRPPLRQIHINREMSCPSTLLAPKLSNRSTQSYFSQRMEENFQKKQAIKYQCVRKQQRPIILSQSSTSSYDDNNPKGIKLASVPLQTPVRNIKVSETSKVWDVGKRHEESKKKEVTTTTSTTPQVQNSKKRAWMSACLDVITPNRKSLSYFSSSRRNLEDQIEHGGDTAHTQALKNDACDFQSICSDSLETSGNLSKQFKKCVYAMTAKVQNLLKTQEENVSKKCKDFEEDQKQKFEEHSKLLASKINSQILEMGKINDGLREESDRRLDEEKMIMKKSTLELQDRINSVNEQMKIDLPKVNKKFDQTIKAIELKENSINDATQKHQNQMKKIARNTEEKVQEQMNQSFLQIKEKIQRSILIGFEKEMEDHINQRISEAKQDIINNLSKHFTHQQYSSQDHVQTKAKIHKRRQKIPEFVDIPNIDCNDVSNFLTQKKISPLKVNLGFETVKKRSESDQVDAQESANQNKIEEVNETKWVVNQVGNLVESVIVRETQTDLHFEKESSSTNGFDDHIADKAVEKEEFCREQGNNLEDVPTAAVLKANKLDASPQKKIIFNKRKERFLMIKSPRRSKRIKQIQLKAFHEKTALDVIENSKPVSVKKKIKTHKKTFHENNKKPPSGFSGFCQKDRILNKKKLKIMKNDSFSTPQPSCVKPKDPKRERSWSLFSSRKRRKSGYSKRAMSFPKILDDCIFSFSTPKRISAEKKKSICVSEKKC